VGAFVFYNLNRPKLARVPNVKNLTLVEAINAFSAAKLKQGTVYRVASEQVPKDRIVDQIPRGGEQVREGNAVTVRISAGSKLVLVPDLLGHTMDEARSMLEELDLVLDDKIEDAPSSKVERGKVIGQKPERRAQAERGQRIRIILSSGPASGDVVPQDRSTEEVAPATDKPAGPVADGSAESSIYNIKLQLTDLKRKAEVKIEMTDDYGTLTVYDESHEPNDIINLKREGHGAQATFRVYYDDELVLTKTQKAKKAKP
jgi:serine/threonine-protein kinase